MSQKSPILQHLLLFLLIVVVVDVLCFACLVASRDSLLFNGHIDAVNVTGIISTTTTNNNRSKEDSVADMFDRALEKEFTENDEQSDATDPGTFNNSVAGQQAVLETVARVTSKRNESKEEKSFQLHDVFNLENENRPEDTPRLIDSKSNVFIMSNPKSKYPVLQLDIRLISDLVVVIVSATCGGIAFACAGQPVITGYLLAGSVIGPGGLSFVSELVQVETFAQFGVIFLLFALGLEFSAAKVLKFLMEKNSISTLYGQVTVGTLILQTNELYQLASVAFCLIVASCSDKLGLSLELGSFAAGVMISTTDLAHHTLEQVEPIRNLFAALFLASIGMLIHVQFLWNHIDILLAAVILVVVTKTFVVATVVKGFKYNNKTALLVGMSLAQIGEFAFVLLSRASNLHLIEGKLYLLLLGTTALSLVTTPFLFKLIPAVVHLGVLLRWFTPDIPTEIIYKGELMRSDTAKRISLMIDTSHDS
ncbi:hypothetical protein M8C21_026996 [Ambrosia artemisiifolia]|uniref:Cation/H+ exchanger transmembrane domain-containing protein n=1 Tax=Ambrosia artemisiifolia TaxID=4212 RepID=A0AAD5G4D2_AMBAR|nr:hypothetical protein M8C21_026996 [Ambrosia artemisiifolia]